MITKQTIAYYNWRDLITEAEKLLSTRQKREVLVRDYAGKYQGNFFNKWCDAKGYGKTDPDGRGRGSSQIWYAEYVADPGGERKEPAYLDFWHWWIDISVDIYNGSTESVNFTELEKEYKTELGEDDWRVIILGAIREILPEEERNIDVKVLHSW